jgi:hypothetical protein
MTLRKKRSHWYGDDHQDIQAEILRYSTVNAYPAEHFASSSCKGCGRAEFRILLDDEAGCAMRICASCESEHFIGDSAEYADEAELDECACPCGKELFQTVVGVHLYHESQDVKWLYLGLRCLACSMTAVYGDWKNECEDYSKLLAMV